ncbi:MAG: TonB-dependent receptor [Gammaproteobacteria bacterium]|nr:TonB-dependent receptor [Gammaproteobacteria bacterium]
MQAKSTLRGSQLALAISAALAATAAAPALAQEPGARLIEEIVVTARKSEERIQDIPIAISALSAQDIQREGISTLEDLGQLLPGFTFDVGAFASDTRPAVRGMQNERGRPSVAVLIDYVDASSENLATAGGSSALRGRLLDVERIELVRGPQTVLYGRNAFGGAINYVTRRPTFEWEGRAGLEAARGGLWALDAGFSGPLIDEQLAFRVGISKSEFGGYYSNPNTSAALGTEDSLAGSLALLFTPNERLTVYGRYQYSDDSFSEPAVALQSWRDRLPVPNGTFAAGPPGSPQLPCPEDLSGLPPQVFAACTRGTFIGRLDAVESDIDLSPNPLTGQPFDGLTQRQRFATLQVDWDVANGTLTYVTGYMRNNNRELSDADYTNFAVTDPMRFSISNINDLQYVFKHTINQLRHVGEVDRWRWTVAAETFNETTRLGNAAQFWLRNPNSALAGPPFFLSTAPRFDIKDINNQSRHTEHYSGALSLGYAVTDQWRVTLEGRYSRDEITYTAPTWSRQQVTLLGQVPLPFCPPETDDRPGVPAQGRYPNVGADCTWTDTIKSNVFTPRGIIEFQPRDTMLFYGSIARGFKPGGIAANEAITPDGQRYDPEKVWAYEVGAKTDWLDNRLRLNGAIYYNDYTDQQIGVQQRPAGSITDIPGITNAGNVEVIGLELDALWQATDNLALSVAYAYTDAEFKEYIQGETGSSALNKAEAGNVQGDFSGNKVGKSPRNAWNVSAEWRQQIAGSDLDWFTQVSGVYRSQRFLDEANLAFLPSYSLVNLRFGLESANLSVIAYIDNLFDDDKIKNAQRTVDLGNPDGFAPGRAYLLFLPQPRTYGLRLNARC